MASIWKVKNSPFYICQYRDATGRRVTRSTKQRKAADARKVAETWDAAGRLAGRHELTRAAATKVLDELMQQVGLGTFKEESISDFLKDWLASRELVGRAASTAKRYRPQINGLISFLGADRCKGSIASLSAAELEAWRDSETAAGKAPKTVNFAMSTIRAALEAAKRKGLVLNNQAAAVEPVAEDADEREPFTPEELQSLVRVASPDWRGMIVLGAHTGIRLTDAANLTWDKIDMVSGTLTFRPVKTQKTTKKDIKVALHTEVVDYLSKLPGGVGLAPVFPTLHGQKAGSSGGLSNQFGEIMRKAGVVFKLGKEKTGKGRRGRSKGFHALRHTMITRLADANVSSDIRREMVGHASDAMHAKYTHLSLEAQRAAVSKMGRISK